MGYTEDVADELFKTLNRLVLKGNMSLTLVRVMA
jgi:hypothetical protein